MYVLYINHIACDVYMYLLLKVFSWGYNSNGELGVGNTSNHTTPKEVSLNGVVTKVNINVQNLLQILTRATYTVIKTFIAVTSLFTQCLEGLFCPGVHHLAGACLVP